MSKILFFKTRAQILAWCREATFVTEFADDGSVQYDSETVVSKIYAWDGASWRVDFFNGSPFLGHTNDGTGRFGYWATRVEYREVVVAPRFEWVPA